MGKEDLTHTATSTVLAEIILRRYAFVMDIQCPATLQLFDINFNGLTHTTFAQRNVTYNRVFS